MLAAKSPAASLDSLRSSRRSPGPSGKPATTAARSSHTRGRSLQLFLVVATALLVAVIAVRQVLINDPAVPVKQQPTPSRRAWSLPAVVSAPFAPSLASASHKLYKSLQDMGRAEHARKPVSAVAATAPACFSDGKPLPRCLVFDLDYTLWPFWVDTHVVPPLRAVASNSSSSTDRKSAAVDAAGMRLAFYRDVPALLANARQARVLVAAASRTHAPPLARQLLGLVRVADASGAADASATVTAASCFDNLQIYPGDKVRHLRRISEELGVGYDDIIFFDDEARNRNVERVLGVQFEDVPHGVDAALVDMAVAKWRRRQRQQQQQEQQEE